MLNAGGQDVMLLPIRMFNVLFGKGYLYPQDWAKAIIIPIQLLSLSLFIKKRNIEQVDNYGGYLYSVL